MSRLLFLIHGMWATPHAWRHWRGYFEQRGWHVVAPPLRHHEDSPLEPAPGLGTTSLLDYAADL
jgi:pimeloyl-ACP methyl ester carboxylesterase